MHSHKCWRQGNNHLSTCWLVLLLQATRPVGLWAARAYCWFMFNLLCIRTPRFLLASFLTTLTIIVFFHPRFRVFSWSLWDSCKTISPTSWGPAAWPYSILSAHCHFISAVPCHLNNCLLMTTPHPHLLSLSFLKTLYPSASVLQS